MKLSEEQIRECIDAAWRGAAYEDDIPGAVRAAIAAIPEPEPTPIKCDHEEHCPGHANASDRPCCYGEPRPGCPVCKPEQTPRELLCFVKEHGKELLWCIDALWGNIPRQSIRDRAKALYAPLRAALKDAGAL